MAVQYRKDRKKKWRVYWNNPHTGRRESESFLTEREAREYDSTILHRLRFEPESFSGIPVEKPQEALTIEALVLLYLEDRKLKPDNLREELGHASAVLRVIGNILTPTLTKNDMRRAVKALKDAGNKQNTINRRVGVIKAALNWAEDEGKIEANPVPRFKCGRGVDERIAPPTPTEAENIFAVAPEHLRRAIVMGLAFGVRVGESEMFPMRWADFDLERGFVRIWAADKNASRPWRDLHLRADLLPLLKAWREDGHEYVIHTYRSRKNSRDRYVFEDGPVTTLKRAWRTALRNAGITRRIRPYDLRHAFATYSLDNGADPKAVAEVMGHADMSMIHKHYQHVLDRQRKAVMDMAPLPNLGTSDGHMKGVCWAHFNEPDSKKHQ